jgi:hypothetical protein
VKKIIKAAAIEQSAHQDLVWLPEVFIQREAAYDCVDGVKDWEMKQYLLLGCKRLPSKALSQALASRGCKGSSWNTSEGTAHRRIWSPLTKHCRTGQPICHQSGDTGHLRRDCQHKFDQGWKSGRRKWVRAKNGMCSLSER